MKRDMDLIRDILLSEEDTDGLAASRVKKFPDDVVIGHVRILHDAGFIEASFIPNETGADVWCRISRLTWSGHEFLDSIRDPSVWQRAKEVVIKPTASWSFEVLKSWLKAELLSRLGLPQA